MEFGIWSQECGVVWYVEFGINESPCSSVMSLYSSLNQKYPKPDVSVRRPEISSLGLCCEGSSDLQMVRRRGSKRMRAKKTKKKVTCSPILPGLMFHYDPLSTAKKKVPEAEAPISPSIGPEFLLMLRDELPSRSFASSQNHQSTSRSHIEFI